MAEAPVLPKRATSMRMVAIGAGRIVLKAASSISAIAAIMRKAAHVRRRPKVSAHAMTRYAGASSNADSAFVR